MKTFLLKIILFAILLLVTLEIVFRTALPAANVPFGTQFPDYGIMAMESSNNPTGHNTIGRFCNPRFLWRVNEAGFNSAIEYKSPSERRVPCAVVIGNSFVEGLYSDVEEHFAGQLHSIFAGEMEVYNLGVSGMPFSQTPLMVKFAEDHYSPQLIIIQTIFNSASGSLVRNGGRPHSQQYAIDGENITVYPPGKFSVRPQNRLARKSAIIRYLYYNRNYNLAGKGHVQKSTQDPAKKVGESGYHALSSPLGLAVQEAMKEIKAIAPNAQVLLVNDANRSAMYKSGEKPARLNSSQLLEDACNKFGFEFLDLTEVFWDAYKANGKKFNFEGNDHWNPYGVSVAAKAVVDKLGNMGPKKNSPGL